MTDRNWRRYGARKPVKWFRDENRDSEELFDFEFWAQDLMNDSSDRVACDSLEKLKTEIKLAGWRVVSICDVNNKFDNDGFFLYEPRYRKNPRMI